MPHNHESCIDNCVTCHRVCLETLIHCLKKGGQHASHEHIRLLEDYVQICQTSADFMIRHSDHHGETCRACSVICAACATECESMTGDDQMEKCAEICRACATSCSEMAKAHGE